MFGRKKKTQAEIDQSSACSFCGKPRLETQHLVAGPEVYICSECLALSIAVLPTEFAVAGLLNALDHMVRQPEGYTPELRAGLGRAALALLPWVGGRAAFCRRWATLAEDPAAALAAFALIPKDERTVWDALNEVSHLEHARQFGPALEKLTALESPGLSQVERAVADCHRALLELQDGRALSTEALAGLRARAEAAQKTFGDYANIDPALNPPFRRALDDEIEGISARIAFKRGAHEQAEAICRRLLDPGPQNLSILMLLGDALAARGKAGEAEAAWREALSQARPGGPIHHELQLRLAGPYR